MKRRWLSYLWGGLLALFGSLVFWAIFWPLPPLATRPPQELAGPGSHFLDLGHIQVHYQQVGEGEPTWLLLHGFGASTFSWREFLLPGTLPGTVYAFDRPAFGLTSRPVPGPYGEEEALTLTLALLDAWGVDEVILVGHSAGARLAALLAQRHPERFSQLVLISPALEAPSSPAAWLPRLLRVSWLEPVARRFIRQAFSSPRRVVESAWYDPAQLTAEVVQGYALPLQADNWDRALWQFTLARLSRPAEEEVALARIPGDVVLIVGAEDRIVAPQPSLGQAQAANVPAYSIPAVGHVPHEEKPQEVREILLRHFLPSPGS